MDEEVIAKYTNSTGDEIMVIRFTNDQETLYNTYENGSLRQYDLTADDVIRWLSNINHHKEVL